jgi:hypothetical protein
MRPPKDGFSALARGMMKLFLPMLMIVWLGMMAGCQWTPDKKLTTWPWKKKEKAERPERMLPVWSDTVLHQPGKPGVRGFGGRIFFYKDQSPEAIEVDGGLAVYVFDADTVDPGSPQPEKKYLFTAEQFKSHLSHSTMGPSYSIWIPWDQVGGPVRNLSIVARFEGTEGGVVISEPTTKLLPGVSEPKNQPGSPSDQVAKKALGNSSASSPVQSASYIEPQAPSAKDGAVRGEANLMEGAIPRRSSSTIDLPPSFQRRMQPASGGARKGLQEEGRIDSDRMPPPLPPSEPGSRLREAIGVPPLGSTSGGMEGPEAMESQERRGGIERTVGGAVAPGSLMGIQPGRPRPKPRSPLERGRVTQAGSVAASRSYAGHSYPAELESESQSVFDDQDAAAGSSGVVRTAVAEEPLIAGPTATVVTDARSRGQIPGQTPGQVFPQVSGRSSAASPGTGPGSFVTPANSGGGSESKYFRDQPSSAGWIAPLPRTPRSGSSRFSGN